MTLCLFDCSSFSRTIEAVSCDEAFIDVSNLVHTDEEAKALAEDIRNAILKATGVSASAGIGMMSESVFFFNIP